MRCRVDGCANEANLPGSARGLCRAHYRRMQRYGTEYEPLRKVFSWKGELCAETACGEQVHAHGLCENHHAKAIRHVNPEKQKIRNAAFKERYRARQEELMGRKRPLHCELCKEPGYGRGNKPNAGICFDHDHKTGKPRGWLCDRCNKVLGLVGDSTALLLALALYLEEHKAIPYSEYKAAAD